MENEQHSSQERTINPYLYDASVFYPLNDVSISNEIKTSADYLAQLLREQKTLKQYTLAFGFSVLPNTEKIVETEINRIRSTLHHSGKGSKSPLSLEEAKGEILKLEKKLYVPQKDYPEFNFVGRILGPRGMTAKNLENLTGCKIMVRGKGSMREKNKEEANRGKPNWEHLSDDLHVLITVEDHENNARIRLIRAEEEVKNLLIPAPEGEDELKKIQLMELAIANGTYRDASKMQSLPLGRVIPGGYCATQSGISTPVTTQFLLQQGSNVQGCNNSVQIPAPLSFIPQVNPISMPPIINYSEQPQLMQSFQGVQGCDPSLIGSSNFPNLPIFSPLSVPMPTSSGVGLPGSVHPMNVVEYPQFADASQAGMLQYARYR